MASPADLHKPSGSDEDAEVGIYAGHFAEDANSVDDLLMITIDSFDPDITWGPAPWPTRVDDSGATVLPVEGDKCAVGLAKSEIAGTAEVWVLVWTPS